MHTTSARGHYKLFRINPETPLQLSSVWKPILYEETQIRNFVPLISSQCRSDAFYLESFTARLHPIRSVNRIKFAFSKVCPRFNYQLPTTKSDTFLNTIQSIRNNPSFIHAFIHASRGHRESVIILKHQNHRRRVYLNENFRVDVKGNLQDLQGP